MHIAYFQLICIIIIFAYYKSRKIKNCKQNKYTLHWLRSTSMANSSRLQGMWNRANEQSSWNMERSETTGTKLHFMQRNSQFYYMFTSTHTHIPTLFTPSRIACRLLLLACLFSKIIIYNCEKNKWYVVLYCIVLRCMCIWLQKMM